MKMARSKSPIIHQEAAVRVVFRAGVIFSCFETMNRTGNICWQGYFHGYNSYIVMTTALVCQVNQNGWAMIELLGTQNIQYLTIPD